MALVLAIHTLYPPKKIHQKLICVVLLTDEQTPCNINWTMQHPSRLRGPSGNALVSYR